MAIRTTDKQVDFDSIKFRWVSIDDVHPNDWNPNVQDAQMKQNTIASICAEGFVDPVTVRNVGDVARPYLELIDGEHRLEALVFIRDHADELSEDVRDLYNDNQVLREMLERNVIPVIDLGDVDKDTAMRLTLQLNGVRGENEHTKLAEVVNTLKDRSSLEELATRLPFSQQRLGELVAMLNWNLGDHIEPPKDDPTPQEKWVTYEFRFPFAVKAIIDSELSRIGELLGYPVDVEELTDVQMGLILEKICVLSADTPTEGLE